MRNLVECNIVIPQIITIVDENERDSFIRQYIFDKKIDPSHVLILKPEKDELSIDQVRQLQKDVCVSFEKEVLIGIYSLDNSGIEVQNSLLKIIEEQGDRLSFLLLVTDPVRLLPTILSRCSLIYYGSKEPHHQEDGVITDCIDHFSFIKNSDTTKGEAVARIDHLLRSHTISSSKILTHILSIRKLVLENNMNPLLALDSILLFLTKPGTIKVLNAKTK